MKFPCRTAPVEYVSSGAGMSYQVADGAEPHRSSTDTGAKLFIVD